MGKRHEKSGYRFTIGRAIFANGKADKWRENLGDDKLTARYRARAMFDIWITHLTRNNMVEAPLNRAEAKRLAWQMAEEQLRYPQTVAAAYNDLLARHPLSPAIKLVPVPVNSDDAVPAGDPPAGSQPPPVPAEEAAVVTALHAAADRWLEHLWLRFREEDISESYVCRAEASVKRLREMVADFALRGIGKPQLDEIRLVFQSRRTRKGKRRDRDTVRTELGHVRSMVQWLDDCGFWTAPGSWERRLRPVFRNDHDDDDADKAKTIDTYTRAEVAAIFAVAPRSLKLWILLALNCAWGASEIATARRKHFKIEKQRVARFAANGHRGPSLYPAAGARGTRRGRLRFGASSGRRPMRRSIRRASRSCRATRFRSGTSGW